jgi:hypothetical protein
MPSFAEIEGTELESPVIVRVYTRAVFITFIQSGVQKRIMTNRRGLEYIIGELTKALDNPLSNQNGVTVLDERSTRRA